jgi:hypothetical protein
MIACYQIDEESRESFIQLLKSTEQVYRAHSVLNEQPILRLESIKDPGYIVEIIEWKSQEALEEVMENGEIQAKWAEIMSSWKRGDFPIGQIPEGSIPWAVMRKI